MARIRTFKPEFWSDEKTGRLSRDARLFFFGLLSEADDAGRLVDSPKRLAGVIFPFDDDVTAKRVERWLGELENVGMIERYVVEGGRYIYIRKFTKHQKISHPKPSSLPPPSGELPEDLRNGSGGPPDNFRPDLGNKGTREVEQGKGSGFPEDFEKPNQWHKRDAIDEVFEDLAARGLQ